MEPRGLTLTGDWTGVYDYADAGATSDAVPFVAILFDVAGAVWGTTRELNTFLPADGIELTADINGTRSGREVQLRKSYLGAPPGGELPITYAGRVSPDGNRIEGRWQILTPRGLVRGAFVMNRKPGLSAEATRLAKSGASVRA